MLLILKDLPLNESAEDRYISAWKTLLGGSKLKAHELERDLWGHLYENLNILDGKAHSLIQLTGVLVAAYAVVLTLLMPGDHAAPGNHQQSSVSVVELLVFILGSVYAAVAVFLSLLVIWVHWSSHQEIANLNAHIRTLIRIRNQRTVNFRRGWTFSGISWLMLIACTGARLFPFPHIPEIDTAIIVLLAVFVVGHLFMVFFYDDVILSLRLDDNQLGGQIPGALRPQAPAPRQ